MRPDRAEALPLPTWVASPAQAPRAANDNELCIDKASAGFIAGQALIVLTVLATAGVVMSSIGWLARAIWRSFF